ncbi:sigma-54-dependent Fis family transcriptional regulator [Thioalkalivibrio denitrificans]|uniref:Sigma-54-dependent Fis family transcriptional regulator n=1 Tax=Thioalkalivibrio denitrificans TaxID=108003 RepID=A0A1V3NFG2_9GAMM|nr:sigma-54 dependent transcriptional regulator [Thioalkalivibrio denitrificans]OOG23592.1 sigma-54-dependent Fis family transcriptional regulator [Thioalkalivibrio denitrificans]
MSIQHVLIVDDEPDIRELLEITLGRMKLSTSAAGTVAEARALLDTQPFDLCLTDMRLPDGNGIELVEHIQKHHPQLPVAMITAYGSMDAAIAALKAGAFDFVSKPVDLKMLRDLVNSALVLARPRSPEPGGTPDTALPGEAPPMQRLRETVRKLSRSQAPVCILGESGSGKERVAREIHRLGPRAERPFVPVNCGAVPTELMESEFFGHVKGAFTGASTDKEGLFQAAQGGTLFLDEVAELPLHMQVKLLRSIQERAVRPVGGNREIPVDVRILSATHRDLAALVTEGQFRQDLFYRLNVIELRVPALRDRLEDLPMLAKDILARIADSWQTGAFHLATDALERLRSYPFPGNIRELENILERAATLCEGDTVHADDLQLPETTDKGGQALDDLLEERERQAILRALEETQGNRTAAARLLGISFRQMRYRLKKLGIE